MTEQRAMPRPMVFVGPEDREEIRNLWPHQILDTVQLLDREHARLHPDGPAQFLTYARVGEGRYHLIGARRLDL